MVAKRLVAILLMLIFVTNTKTLADANTNVMVTTVSDDTYQVWDTTSGTFKTCSVLGKGPLREVLCY